MQVFLVQIYFTSSSIKGILFDEVFNALSKDIESKEKDFVEVAKHTYKLTTKKSAKEIYKSLRKNLKCEDLNKVDIFVRDINQVNTKKKIAIFDMDSTLVVGETLDDLAKDVGIGEEISEITAQAMRGEIDFNQSFKKRMSKLAGVDLDIANNTREKIKLQQGAIELFEYFKSEGIKTMLVSGGFDFFAKKPIDILSIDFSCTNKLLTEENKITGRVEENKIIDGTAKLNFITKTLDKLGIKPSEAIAFGDGANDLPMLNFVGTGIGFSPKDILRKQINNSIDCCDLSRAIQVLQTKITI
jgi:phosphoserine phosphatase